VGVLVPQQLGQWLENDYELRKLDVPSAKKGAIRSPTPGRDRCVVIAEAPPHAGRRSVDFHVAQSPLGPVVGLKTHEDDAAARRFVG